MNHHHPYRPQISQIPADLIRVDTHDPRRSTNPHPGICPAPRTVPCYWDASPDGERHHPATGRAQWVTTVSNRTGSPTTANYSLLTANSTVAPPAPPAHPILNSSFLILNWSYTFSAKERDSETGLSYFGSRYYSSDLSIWLSVDPMSDKYPSLSPYVYCANNPVRVVDPNGEDVWIPDGEGNVVAQEKDDYRSLAVTIDCSYHKAKKMLAAQGYENGVKEGDKVKLDNPYTRSINAHCERRLTDEQAEAYYQKCRNAGMSDEDIKTRLTELACPQDLYNCWSAAMAGSTNQEIGPATYDIFDETTFDDKLSKCKWPVSVDRLKFGKTIIRFEKNGVCTHAAVYYGTDKSGNIYIYTKNGKYTRPFVIPLNEFIERYGDLYGKVSGYYN